MINPSETQAPVEQTGKIINTAETVPPGGAGQNITKQSIILMSGESIGDSFIVHSLMDKHGKQADVYLTKRWGKNYVAKVYHNGWHPSEQIQSFLKSVQHPNIAHVFENGEQSDGSYYEIYEHFSEGTLEDVKTLTSTHIQNVIVPSINEGLHVLHTNGIIHCDIKPSNLFYADDKKRVVIGDCGISGYTNEDGVLTASVRGTPEYAPPVVAVVGNAVLTSAHDYGSFGLVLCRVALGHSLFEGYSVEEIALAWNNGLEIPNQIGGRLSILIKGLLNKNENERWGYNEVRRWCEGEYMRPTNRSLYANVKKEKTIKPFIFGKFDGETVRVSTMHELELAIKRHWAQATNVVRRQELIDFVSQFDDTELVKKIRALQTVQDRDAAVFKLLSYIADDKTCICYCGKEYADLPDYVEKLATGKDETAKKFLMTGLLVFFLRTNDYEQSQVDKIEQLIKRNSNCDMADISTICYALQGKKDVDVYGVSVQSLDDLIPVLRRCTIADIDELLHNDRFIAWLNRLGYEKEIRKMKEECG